MGQILSKFKIPSAKSSQAPNSTMNTKDSQSASSSSSTRPTGIVPNHPGIINPSGFKIQSVDNKLLGQHANSPDGASVVQQPLVASSSTTAAGATPSGATATVSDEAPLGILEKFKGDFTGRGLNTIFRPNNGTKFNTNNFPNPIPAPAIPQPPNENVLELNLTKERLSFATSLGTVPNRGLADQQDINLNGIPYLQSISDVTNIDTGKGDGNAVPIHFEPGLWMHIPATTNDPVNAESLVRMASIPHGTTINAQSTILDQAKNSPTITINGPPDFTQATNKASITPFPIGGGPLIPFRSQTLTNINTPRLPQDLSKFNATGTITQAILDNPNQVLADAIKGQNIIETTVFKVSTVPAAPELGGGTANIAFLDGTTIAQANAQAISMEATFWVETLEWKLQIPIFDPNQGPLTLQPDATHPGTPLPSFTVKPQSQILHPITITVQTTQIQYSQTVLLNFAGLSWPHVSVATLTPADPHDVTHAVFTSQ